MYSSTLSLTSALEGGGWSTLRPGRFTPRKDLVPIVGPRVGLDGCGKSSPPPPGFDPRTVQPVASRYTERDIPAQYTTVRLSENLVETEVGGSTSWARKRMDLRPAEGGGTDTQVPSSLCWTPNSDTPTRR